MRQGVGAYRSVSSLISAAEKRGKTDTSETRGDGRLLVSITLDTGDMNLKAACDANARAREQHAQGN